VTRAAPPPDRIELPSSPDAEERLVGSPLIDPEVLSHPAIEKVRADHFFSERMSTLWQAILDLHASRNLIDLPTLTEKLRITRVTGFANALESVGGMATLLAVMDAGNPLIAVNDAQIILDDHTRRVGMRAAQTALSKFADRTVDVDEVIEGLDKSVTDLVRDPSGVTSVHAAYTATLGRTTGSTKVKSGFYALDSKFAGFPFGDLTVIAARSTTGKSSLCYQLLLSMANRLDKPVGILSPDQEFGEIFSVMTARLAGVSTERIDMGKATPDENRKFAHAAQYVRDVVMPYVMVRDGNLHHMAVEREVDKLVRQGASVILVDTLQAISEGRLDKKSQLDQTCLLLKNLAREYRIPIIAVSQIKQETSYRKVNGQPDTAPKDYDCDGSKNIFDYANTMIFLHRPWFDDDKSDPTIVDYRIAKQKVGQKNIRGTLRWVPELQLFQNYGGDAPGIQIDTQPYEPL
jgi:replicative DNA helicase